MLSFLSPEMHVMTGRDRVDEIVRQANNTHGHLSRDEWERHLVLAGIAEGREQCAREDVELAERADACRMGTTADAFRMSAARHRASAKAGFFANLTPEQRVAALAYRGPDEHGYVDFRPAPASGAHAVGRKGEYEFGDAELVYVAPTPSGSPATVSVARVPERPPVAAGTDAPPATEARLAGTPRFATEEELRAQRASWVRGEMAWGSDADEARDRAAYMASIASRKGESND